MGPSAKIIDLDAVKTFALIASLANFTRVAEASGTTQSAVSLKLRKLEAFLGRRLVERTPRSVRLTTDGLAFLEHAKSLLAASERAMSFTAPATHRLKLGISDHAAGPQLPTLLARLGAADPNLVMEVSIGFSRSLLDGFDEGRFDGVIVRRERSRRGGEALADDELSWFAAPSYEQRPYQPLRLASLASPCGVRAIAIRALDARATPWHEVFVGGGVAAVAAAVVAGLGVAALARRIAPAGSVDVGRALQLPQLPRSKVMLYSRVSDARSQTAFRVLASVFRGMA
jgi:DNA-binding transcriptional LysR family regulator